MTQDPLIDVKDLSQMLSVSERTIYDLVRDGEIPYVKVGRLIRFDATSVMAYLTVSPKQIVEIKMSKPAKSYVRGGEKARDNYKHYARGSRNPFKNYDDFGNLIAKDGDE